MGSTRIEDGLTEVFKIVDKFVERYQRRSENTTNKYRFTMRRLLSQFCDNGLETDPDKIGEKEVNYILDMRISDNTKLNYVTILKRFCYYMSKDRSNVKIYKMDITYDIVIKNKKTIEYEDYLKLLGMVDDPNLRMAIILGGELGLRRSEICNLNIEDVNGQWITIVRGKGKKTSRLPMNKILCEELSAYMDYRNTLVGKYNCTSGKLILYEWGGIKELTVAVFYERFKKLCKEIDVEASPHALRSMYITNKLDSGVPLPLMKELARHTNVNMTMKYYRPRDDILMKMQNVSIDRTNPIENAKKIGEGLNTEKQLQTYGFMR